jgi:hypothetical protein
MDCRRCWVCELMPTKSSATRYPECRFPSHATTTPRQETFFFSLGDSIDSVTSAHGESGFAETNSIPLLLKVTAPAGRFSVVEEVAVVGGEFRRSMRPALIELPLGYHTPPDRQRADQENLRAHHHSITAAPQVSPAPNTRSSSRSPRSIFPARTTSSSASPTEAAEVFPNRSTFI